MKDYVGHIYAKHIAKPRYRLIIRIYY